MIQILIKPLLKLSFFIALFCSFIIKADNFSNNTYNNHGVVGLVNIPTARLYDEGVHGITLYDGTPDQKITLSSNPYDWFEASFFTAIFKDCLIQDMNIRITRTKDLT